MKPIDELYSKVISNLEANLPGWLTYHNARHTQYVFDKAILIGEAEDLSEKDLYLLKLAALFHDTGYLVDPKNHEEESCKIAGKDLVEFGIKREDLDLIFSMIMATRLPQNPTTKLEMILADADLEYLGTEEFDTISEKLYLEIKHSRPEMTISEWYSLQIDFISKHKYHTAFCRKYREHKKLENLQKIKERLRLIS